MTTRFVEHDHLADLPYPQAAETLRQAGTIWLAELAWGACVDAYTVCIRVGPGEVAALRKAFDITIGIPYELASGLLIPTLWQATGPTTLFPTMEADLRICPAPDSDTRLCLQGRYTPPLGDRGARLDELLLHRVVATSIDTFLAELARTVTTTDASTERPQSVRQPPRP